MYTAGIPVIQGEKGALVALCNLRNEFDIVQVFYVFILTNLMKN